MFLCETNLLYVILTIMEKYKALLVDFDGTLANPHTGEVDLTLKNAILEIMQKGYLVSIATGRPYWGRIREVCADFGLTSPQIVHGGAEIRDPKDGSILWGKYLQDSDLKDIIQYLLKTHVYFSVEKDSDVYTPDGKESIYRRSYNFKKVSELTARNIPKIVVPSIMNTLSFEAMEKIIKDLESMFKNIHIIKGKIGDHFGFDITSGEATKHTAALEYMKMLGLDPDEVVGVGDGYNDYPLLTACGVKVAMGDAPQELKNIADMVAPSWETHGLREVIQKYFEPPIND